MTAPEPTRADHTNAYSRDQKRYPACQRHRRPNDLGRGAIFSGHVNKRYRCDQLMRGLWCRHKACELFWRLGSWICESSVSDPASMISSLGYWSARIVALMASHRRSTMTDRSNENTTATAPSVGLEERRWSSEEPRTEVFFAKKYPSKPRRWNASSLALAS